MQRIKLITMAVMAGIAAIGLAVSSAQATVIHIVDSEGQLTGAQNVDINGMLFDVSLIDGSCIALFDGCDEAADYDFTTESSAMAAAQALLDQVFIDTGAGDFDSLPELTFGCGPFLFNSCNTIIPFELGDPTVHFLAGFILIPDNFQSLI